MAFNDLHALFAGVSPVAVHDEGDVVRDGARFEDAEEDASDAVDGIVTKPEGALQKRHNGGESTAGDRVPWMEAFTSAVARAQSRR